MNIFKLTALYGKGFKATDKTGVFSLKVYTGGFAGVRAATERASQEAESFRENSGYSEFKILGSKSVWFPFSYHEFLIAFR